MHLYIRFHIHYNYQISKKFTNEQQWEYRHIISMIIKYIKTHGYTAPFLITLTYLVLVIVPLILAYLSNRRNDHRAHKMAEKIWLVTYPLNNISDAVIYVILDRDIRKYLKRKFSSRTTQDDNENNTSTPTQLIDTTLWWRQLEVVEEEIQQAYHTRWQWE